MTIKAMNEMFADLIKADGYSIHLHEGQVRLQRMRQAWNYARQKAAQRQYPDVEDIREIGCLIEPVKNFDWRRAHRPNGSPAEQIESDLKTFVNHIHHYHAIPMAAAQLFTRIDPFVEGTQRVLVLLQEWVNSIPNDDETDGSTHQKI